MQNYIYDKKFYHSNSYLFISDAIYLYTVNLINLICGIKDMQAALIRFLNAFLIKFK